GTGVGDRRPALDDRAVLIAVLRAGDIKQHAVRDDGPAAGRSEVDGQARDRASGALNLHRVGRVGPSDDRAAAAVGFGGRRGVVLKVGVSTNSSFLLINLVAVALASIEADG